MSLASCCTRLVRRAHVPGVALGGVMMFSLSPLPTGIVSGLNTKMLPGITSVTPAEGPVAGGTRVAIYGVNFLGPANVCGGGEAVYFGASPQYDNPVLSTNFQVVSDREIVAFSAPDYGGKVDVQVHNMCGTSAPTPGSDSFTYEYDTSQCLSGTCQVSVDANTEQGPISHVGNGFNEGYNSPNPIPASVRPMIAALQPSSWRVGGGTEPNGLFGLARASGAKVNALLETDWLDSGGTLKPWTNFAAFYRFIDQDVQNREKAGTAPDYWDVWNEPDGNGTVNDYLSVYQTAYGAIKAADPNANVIGPSIGFFLTTPTGNGNSSGYALDLATFASFASRNNLHFVAVSYHDEGLFPPPGILGVLLDNYTPTTLGADVQKMTSMLAAYPDLKGTQVIVDEYGPVDALLTPGWIAGSVASLESSGAATAEMTCADSGACTDLMDGLFTASGTPQMPYWVLDDYAHMTGQRVATSSSGVNFSSLATRNDASSQLQILVGRHDECGSPPRPFQLAGIPDMTCPQFQAPLDSPVSVSLSMADPYGGSSAQVTTAPLPNTARQQDGSDPVPSAPSATTTTLPVVNGNVSVPLGAVGDGDAFSVTLTP